MSIVFALPLGGGPKFEARNGNDRGPLGECDHTLTLVSFEPGAIALVDGSAISGGYGVVEETFQGDVVAFYSLEGVKVDSINGDDPRENDYVYTYVSRSDPLPEHVEAAKAIAKQWPSARAWPNTQRTLRAAK